MQEISHKVCTGCKVSKSIDDFYFRGGGQRRADCRNCHDIRTKKYANTSRGKQVRAAYARTERGKKARKEAVARYIKTEKGKKARRRSIARYRQRIKDRERDIIV